MSNSYVGDLSRAFAVDFYASVSSRLVGRDSPSGLPLRRLVGERLPGHPSLRAMSGVGVWEAAAAQAMSA